MHASGKKPSFAECVLLLEINLMRTSLCLIYKAHYIEFDSFSAWMLELSLLIKWLENVSVKTAAMGWVYILPPEWNSSSDPCFKVQVLFSALLAASPPAPSLSDHQTWGHRLPQVFPLYPGPQRLSECREPILLLPARQPTPQPCFP